MTLQNLKDNWPSPIVARNQLAVFSGGLLNPKTIRNLDSMNKGIPGKLRLNRKVFYPVDNVIQWMESQITNGKDGDNNE